ncbi:hypothetical protein DL93DRAFT_2079284 [Clavulina sp. PMI_390]|nr:hypothetical protein DL93DRAFT_2079284 [Clavulina sp. PMI_390]
MTRHVNEPRNPPDHPADSLGINPTTELSLQYSSDHSAKQNDHASQSAILRLPFEIMSEISLLAMLPLSLSMWKSPLLAVNSWWRACVVNTPRIWSCVEVRGGTHAKERLECWINRSGAVPLYVTVWDAWAFQLLETLWVDGDPNPGRRIHQLTIHHDDTDQPFPFPISFETPNLRGLNAAFSYMRAFHDDHPFILLSPNSAAKLETLRVHNDFFSPGVINPAGLDVSSLKSLAVQEEITPEDVLDILKQAPNLTQLKWTIPQLNDREEGEFPSEAPRLVLQSMLHLELSWELSRLNFFRVSQVPNVQTLSLKGRWEHGELSSLLSSVSECREITHLRILSTRENKPSEDDVALLCRALPKLVYMDPGWRDSNVDALLSLSSSARTSASRTQGLHGEVGRQVRLPLKEALEFGHLSRDRLASSLRKLLNAVKPRRNAVKAATKAVTLKSMNGIAPSPNYFVVMVDVDTKAMVSMVGGMWQRCGGVSVESLPFPTV